jgi:histidinol dehydrogenase
MEVKMKNIVFELPRDENELKQRLKPRKRLLDRSLIIDISKIFDDVEVSGDNAIMAATRRYDQVDIPVVAVPEEYVDQSVSSLSPNFRAAIETAISNIREVNQALMPDVEWRKEVRPDTIIGEKFTPLESVGVYVPATKGPLVSTAMMLVTAAQVAGVKNIVVGMPPQKNGRANASTVAAARLAGAHRFVVGNGVSIIAGLTLGTESVPEVNGIYGPGPAGIAAAMSVAFSYGKRTVVGIGPTDCAVVADETANAAWIARDLMCEAEHGPDSSALLVTTSRRLAEQVVSELEKRIRMIDEEKRRILANVFGEKGMGAVAVVPDAAAACSAVNAYAPEHLMITCSEETTKEILERVEHAGEILIGDHTPFAAANFAIGITAVLPTNAFARVFSGITSKDMLKSSTIGKLSRSALERLRPAIEEIGKHEGFPCHVDSVAARYD